MPRRRGLGSHVGPGRVVLVDPIEHEPVQVVAAVGVGQAEGQRPTRGRGDIGQQVDLGSGVGIAVGVTLAHAGCGLEHAPLVAAHDPGDGQQLVVGGPRARHRAPVGHPVQQGARGREAERAGAYGLVDQGAHPLDVVRPGRLLGQAALAHGVDPDRAVADHAANVDALGPTLDRVQVLAVARPVPGQTLHDRIGRDVLDRLHHLGQLLAVARLARREGDPAIAQHHRGHPVPARRRTHRVPGQLGVEMGVDVDEAGGDVRALGIDDPPALTHLRGGAHRHHSVAIHRHVGAHGRRAGAVDHRAVGDHQIVHVVPPAQRARHSD